jgi:hypothetical protein
MEYRATKQVIPQELHLQMETGKVVTYYGADALYEQASAKPITDRIIGPLLYYVDGDKATISDPSIRLELSFRDIHGKIYVAEDMAGDRGDPLYFPGLRMKVSENVPVQPLAAPIVKVEPRDELTVQFKIQQRAYLSVYSVALTSANVGDTIRSTVLIKNSGKTPARDVRYAIRSTSGASNIEVEKLIEQFMGEKTYDQGPGVQPPDGNVRATATTRDRMLAEEVSDFKKGLLPTYVYGRISYNDVFGEAHQTNFCARWDSEIQAFGFCQKHNNAN